MAETCIVCLGDLGASAPDPPLLAARELAQNDAGEPDERSAFDASDPPPFPIDPSDNEQIAHLLPCGHDLHDECLKPWVERANSCPICRQNFNTVELITRIGGPIVSSYSVSDRVQVADIDPSMLIEEFDEPEAIPCPKCGNDDNEDVLLLCDGCDGAFHTYCVGLDSVPVGHWFCEDCSTTRAIESVTDTLRSSSHHASDRRTRGQLRRTRNRNQVASSSWARVWQTVWDRLNIDLDFPFDENASASRYQFLQGNQSSNRQAYRGAWERRLQIAERQGGASRLREAAPALLDRPTISRPRPELPEPESVEEILAWNALEKARDIQADPTPKSRKRKSATSSPAEPDTSSRSKKRKSATTSPADAPSNSRKRKWESPPTSPSEPAPMQKEERRLKRPQTRRAHDLADISTEGIAESSNSRKKSVTAVRGAGSPEAINPNAPSFLQSLLKEVETSAVPDEPRNGLAVSNNASDHPSPQNSSPGASPTTSNHPSPRAMSGTPPPMSARSLSPVPLTSKVEPIYPPAPDLSTIESSPPPEKVVHRQRHSKSQTRVGRWATHAASYQASSSPPRPRSEEISPTRANMSLSAKETLQRLVKEALKVPYLNKLVNKDQYTEINRNVSRMLYDRVGEEAASVHGDDEATEWWKKMAAEEVDRALSSMQQQ